MSKSIAAKRPLPTFSPSKISYPLAPELERREAKGLRCLACARECVLPEGGVGFCTAIAHHSGQLFSTAYGVVAEASVTPIESKPVYHYHPGARVLSIGGLGCNLRCRFCQNWEIAFRDARSVSLSEPNLPPDAAVQLALAQQCVGLAWTFNEPSISPMYVLDCAKRARAAGLFTVYVTNGLMTREAMALLGPWLDVYRVDLKSVVPAHYARFGATSQIQDLLPLARIAQEEHGCHVEVVTNLMPGLNDSDEHIANLSAQVVAYLGDDTPLHFTSYVPYAFMRDTPPTPPATLVRARRLAREVGLRFIYTDNIETPETAHTYCPRCGSLAIERSAHMSSARLLTQDGRCGACGEPLNMVVGESRTSRDEQVNVRVDVEEEEVSL